MGIYKPTWLYIKQHNHTGLKYFGKTVCDPSNYRGSGKYWLSHWLSHLQKHGNDITTVWCKLFEDRQELVEYALQFSTKNNIVDSIEWANLKPENGLDGGTVGTKVSQSTKEKLSKANLGKHHSIQTCSKISESNKGKHSTKRSAETRAKMSKSQMGISKGKKVTEETRKKMSESGGKHLKGKPWSDARRAAHKTTHQ
jgi:hypothetical protein